MDARFTVGDRVQTPLGKGVVREVRNHGRLLIDIGGRAVVFDERAVARVKPAKRSARARFTEMADVPPVAPARGGPVPEIDLHGLTIDEAIARVEEAVNRALLEDTAEIRFIHGRSGGRIRGALHRWLRRVRSIRTFRLDPRNPGVTIVSL